VPDSQERPKTQQKYDKDETDLMGRQYDEELAGQYSMRKRVRVRIAKSKHAPEKALL
jgi:hypothetical protein